jgi:anti-sigma factor RsiW
MLVAFVDGELDAEDSLAVHVALRHDPALRERVRLMRESAALLRAAYGDVARQPLPPALTSVIRTAAGGRRRVRSRWLPAAIAATIALAVGLSAGSVAPRLTTAWQRPDAARPDAPGVATGGPLALLTPGGAPEAVLHRTLERERSGTSVAWTDPDSKSEVTVEPLRTYRAADHTFCREYRETVAIPSAPAHTGYGLACRTAGGRWNVQYVLLPAAQPADFSP